MEIRHGAAALLASTALMLPGAALAQGVTLSGFAEMGVADNGGKHPDGTDVGVEFHQDIDVTFKMTGETDQGVMFGAAVDLDEDAGAVGTDDAGVSAYVSGVFGRIELGDTDGGFDWALEETAGLGSLGDNHEHKAWSGNGGLDAVKPRDGQILRYDTGSLLGDFAIGVSMEQDTSSVKGTTAAPLGRVNTSDDVSTPNGTPRANGDAFGIGGKGSFEVPGATLAAGVGYQRDDRADIVGGSFSASFPVGTGNLKLVGNYSVMDDDMGTTVNAASPGQRIAAGQPFTGTENNGFADSDDKETVYTGVGATYTMGPIGLHANYGNMDVDGPDAQVINSDGDNLADGTVGNGKAIHDVDGFGVAATYDLGGGAQIQFGYGNADFNNTKAETKDDKTSAVQDVETWSFGLKMAF